MHHLVSVPDLTGRADSTRLCCFACLQALNQEAFRSRSGMSRAASGVSDGQELGSRSHTGKQTSEVSDVTHCLIALRACHGRCH